VFESRKRHHFSHRNQMLGAANQRARRRRRARGSTVEANFGEPLIHRIQAATAPVWLKQFRSM
jgi:hypothetical protein